MSFFRIDQLFDIIVDYPDSKAAVSDLKVNYVNYALLFFFSYLFV